MRNHALNQDTYNTSNQGDFGSDFGDFDSGTGGEDPWYSKSPEKSTSAYGQQESDMYGRSSSTGDEMNAQYTGRFDIEEDFGDEPPLLEELGIRFDHIWSKTQAVLVPTKVLTYQIHTLFSFSKCFVSKLMSTY
jgi:hypothetical protein